MPERSIPNIVPVRLYQPGERVTSNEFDVDNDVTEYTLALNRSGMVDSGREIIRATVEAFINGEWRMIGGFGTRGGVKLHRFGHTILFSGINFRIPQATGRRIRTRFEVIDEITIRADLDLLVRRNGSGATRVR